MTRDAPMTNAAKINPGSKHAPRLRHVASALICVGSVTLAALFLELEQPAQSPTDNPSAGSSLVSAGTTRKLYPTVATVKCGRRKLRILPSTTQRLSRSYSRQRVVHTPSISNRKEPRSGERSYSREWSIRRLFPTAKNHVLANVATAERVHTPSISNRKETRSGERSYSREGPNAVYFNREEPRSGERSYSRVVQTPSIFNREEPRSGERSYSSFRTSSCSTPLVPKASLLLTE